MGSNFHIGTPPKPDSQVIDEYTSAESMAEATVDPRVGTESPIEATVLENSLTHPKSCCWAENKEYGES